jgi:prepilin-type processing-associated H-X9-DG protein/prepilin-type N-terminal cleavage/methylation domain-containing protein
MNPAARTPRRGVTLVEVLVVIGLIGLLVGLLLSAVQGVRAAAVRMACANNLRQIGLACHHYHDVYGTLPPGYRSTSMSSWGDVRPWQVLLLPYLEHQQLWDTVGPAYQLAFGFQNPPHVGLATVVKTYACPADGRLSAPITDDAGFTAAYGSYLGVSGSDHPDGREMVGNVHLPNPNGAIWGRRGVRFVEITDGQSQTLLVGERPPPGRYLFGTWYNVTMPDPSLSFSSYRWGSTMPVYQLGDVEPFCRGPFQFGPGRLENPCDSWHFWSLHPGGANFVFCDGSVHFLRYSARDIMPALATRAGGEVVALPD